VVLCPGMSTRHHTCRDIKPNDLRIGPQVLTLFLLMATPSASFAHQDNASLKLMMTSIEVDRYVSGIKLILLLLSSSTPYPRLNVSKLREVISYLGFLVHSPERS